MALFRRGKIWWYEFRVRGQRVRESSRSGRKTLARQAERTRRREIAEGIARVSQKLPGLFGDEAETWLDEMRPHWQASTMRVARSNVAHLTPMFGNTLLADISAGDIRRYQLQRHDAKAGHGTINMEVGSLRAVLRRQRLWERLKPDVRMLRVRTDIGRALTENEQRALLAACRKSRSRGLFIAVLLSIATGLRNFELRHLRWMDIDLRRNVLRVSRSKTAGGEGREVPLSKAAAKAVREWRARFENVQPEHFVFPGERAGFPAKSGAAHHHVDMDVPITSWATAWRTAKEQCGVKCRWHDMRHTFASELAENGASDATIQSLMGHMSAKMKERYSHTRLQAKRRAVERG